MAMLLRRKIADHASRGNGERCFAACVQEKIAGRSLFLCGFLESKGCCRGEIFKVQFVSKEVQPIQLLNFGDVDETRGCDRDVEG
jgi:hypothetical protein